MKKYLIYLLMLLLFSIGGCKEFVTVDAPKNQVIADAVFSSDGQATAAMTGIYAQMVNKLVTYNIPFRTGLAADELTNYSTNGAIVQIYQNNLQALDAPTNNFWNNGYNFIYQANAILEGCSQSNLLNADVKKQLLAEARFLRAFWYFYLVNFYGDVPLLTTTDYQSNALVARNPSSEVYHQILADLDYAANHLGSAYVDASSKNGYTERVRPNRFSAYALLARVYLFLADWEKAEQMATTVINQTTLYDTVPVSKVFLRNEKEAIWQLLRPGPSTNLGTYEAQMFTLTTKPISRAGSNCAALSPQILEAFEDGDGRRTNWIGTYIDETVMPHTTYYFCHKYKAINTSSTTEYSIVLRLSEQYLIRAEARVQLGDIEGALKDLNIIRLRAGLSPFITDNKAKFLTALLHERQVELFTEWGHRWLDLKRTGKVDKIMTDITPEKGGGTWNSSKQWWPIPQKEIENNPNLQQNKDYN